jgi:hypothetical protein
MKPANKWGFAGGFEVERYFSATRLGVNFDVGGVALEGVDCHFFLGFLAVLADALKAAAVGAPLVPGLRMVSLLPAAMRLRFAAMLLYKPGLAITF